MMGGKYSQYTYKWQSWQMYVSRESHIPSYKLIIVNNILLLKMVQDINLQEKQINTIFTATKSNLYFSIDGESHN